MSRRLKTKLDSNSNPQLSLGGQLQGADTYLRVTHTGNSGMVSGVLSGHRLYRLAKTIVRQFEKDHLSGKEESSDQ